MKHLIHTQLSKRIAAVVAFIIFSLAGIQAQTSQPDKVHLGFIYPISTHGTYAALDTNNFSFHVLAGVSAAEEGLAFAGLSNVVRYDVNGIAFAGFSNHIGKSVNGLLFAGFANTYRSARGFQFAGFTNVATGNVVGAQFSGFLNHSANLTGAQFAGFANVAKVVEGPQFAGFVNVARKIKGSQFAGFANITDSGVEGSQFAGFINRADTVKGSQVAGFINIARKVKGAQIAGFINIADSSDCPIGIINLIKNGEKSIGFSIDENQTTLVSFRSGGKKLYGIIGAGYNFKNQNELYAFEAGLGAHFFESSTFRINAELATVCLESFHPGEYFKSSLSMLPTIKLGKSFEIFGGPSVSFINTNTNEGKDLTKTYLYEHQNRWSNDFQGIYIGYATGLNIKF